MPARCQSARTNASQPGIEMETPTTPLCKTPATVNRKPEGKQKGDSKLAPQATLVASPVDHADVLAIESDLGMAPEPVDSAQNLPHKQGHLKCQGDGEDPATQIGEPVKKQNITNLTKPEVPCARAKKVIPPQSPLPKHVNCVVDPAKPDMPRAKHTSAVVTAAEAKKSKLLLKAGRTGQAENLTSR